MLGALDAALRNLREASTHGADNGSPELRDGWSAVARAVAAERDACEGLPLEAASPEGCDALAMAAEEIGESQQARHEAAHSLAKVGESQLEAGRGPGLQWTPLVALEEGEAQLAQLHSRAASSHAS